MQLFFRRHRAGGVTLAALAVLVLLAPLAGAARRDTRAPAAAPTALPTIELVREGATPFRVEVRSPDAVEAGFAAGELTKYLGRISGATLATADAKTAPGPRVVIGMRRDLSAADRALLPPAAKGFDGYAIAVSARKGSPPRIVIGGDQPRGLVYGVYDLLERLGCRFTHPALDPGDPEIVPSARDLTLPAGRWAVASPLEYRTLAWFEWRRPARDGLASTPEELAAQIDWAMKCRYNAFESAAIELPPDHPLARALHVAKQRGMLLQSPGHNFDLFLPSDPATFAAHPNWFGLRKGQRVQHAAYGAQFCWTNAEAQKAFTENVVAFVKERPDLDILELSGLDGGTMAPACECDECARQGSTDNVINLLNGVVRRLAKERPDLVVETLGGYQYAAQPPRSAKPDPRLRVFWADWDRVPMAGYASSSYAKRIPGLEAWVEAFDGRVTVFQYYADHYKHAWFMGPLAVQMIEDREYILKHRIDGLLTLLYPDGYWWRSSINAWLAGNVFYDTSVDPFALLRAYALAYYGPAGEPMAAYLDEWARDPQLGMRTRIAALPVHFGKLRQQRKTYLAEATRLAEGDPVAARRVATIVRMHDLADALMAVDLMGSNSDGLRDKGDLEGARRELEAAHRRLGVAKALAAELVAEKRGLVDPEISTSVFAFKEKALDARDKALAKAVTTPAAGATGATGPTGAAPSSAATPATER